MSDTQLALPEVNGRFVYTMPAKATYWRDTWHDSLLEARHAVRFNYMGVDYIYHPRRLRNRYGVPYTPDFSVPDFKLVIEIKPVYDLTLLERTAFVPQFGVHALTIFGTPGDPDERACLQVLGGNFYGGRIYQCASYKLNGHRRVYCAGLMLVADEGPTQFTVPVGFHEHRARGYVNVVDEGHDRDITAGNRAALAEKFPPPDDGSKEC